MALRALERIPLKYSLLRRIDMKIKFKSSPFFCFAKNRLADYGSVFPLVRRI